MDYMDEECPARGPALSHAREMGLDNNGTLHTFCGECGVVLYARPGPVDPPFDIADRLEKLGLTPWQGEPLVDDEDDEDVNIHEEKHTDPDRWGRDRDTLSVSEKRHLEAVYRRHPVS